MVNNYDTVNIISAINDSADYQVDGEVTFLFFALATPHFSSRKNHLPLADVHDVAFASGEILFCIAR